MRTEAQKIAFALNCKEIEKEGGDVLAFIEKNWPSYTPRATWYNLQKQYLGRNVNQLTEGKPKNERKEVNTMRKRRDKNVVFEEVLKVIEAHGDPVAWFEEEGYSIPLTGWQDLKKWARIHRPDDVHKLPENLRRYYSENGIKRVYKTSDEKKASENPTIDQKAAETIFFGGKEYEKLEGEGKPVNEYREKPSPTCCQPAKPSGVTVPDELPEEQLAIAALMSNVVPNYKYELLKMSSGVFMVLNWQDKMTNQEHNLILTPDQWRKLSMEIITALKQLGM